MIIYKDECVGCPKEIGCLGDSCPYRHVPRHYCDKCGREGAEFAIDGQEEYCKECVKEILSDIFSDMDLSEQANMLGISISKISE